MLDDNNREMPPGCARPKLSDTKYSRDTGSGDFTSRIAELSRYAHGQPGNAKAISAGAAGERRASWGLHEIVKLIGRLPGGLAENWKAISMIAASALGGVGLRLSLAHRQIDGGLRARI